MSSDFLLQDKFSFLKIYQKWHLFVSTIGIRQLKKLPVLMKLLIGCILSYLLSISCFYLTLKPFHLGMFTQFWENSKWSFDEEAFQKPQEPVLTLTPHPLSICLLLVIVSCVFLSFLCSLPHCYIWGKGISNAAEWEIAWYFSAKKRLSIVTLKYVFK